MWILETTGDIFQGKRLWLRPGKRFLFGRTRAAEGDFAVADKTISRSHLLVEVSSVDPQEAGNPRSRSKVTITDQGTKIGTTLNGKQIRSEKDHKVGHVLQNEVNIIVLGKYPHELRISWKPVALTFSFTSKEHKANPYTALYKRLGPLDVKVLVEYENGTTTHVAARKRNTAKGLQALVDGKYIVDHEKFVKALESIATNSDGPSALEVDFDKNFPNPLQYLPAKGDEPTSRDESAYAPNPARKDMFEGYTFVFYEKRQYETLMAPITTGRGKALLHEAVPDQTEVLDFVRYVKGVAGEKGLGEFEDGSLGRGVVVVRFNPVKGEATEWFKEFGQQVSIHLDQRFVEQNEFLDAILGVDASVLRRPLEEVDSSGIVAPTPSVASNNNTQRGFPASSQYEQPERPTQPEAASQMAPPESAPLGRRGRRMQSRFRGFGDDDDNFSSLPPPSSVDDMVIDPPSSAQVASQPESQGLFVSQDPEVEVPSPRRSATPPPIRPTRKRAAQSDDAFIDSIAPAAAAVKRRKLAEESARRLRGESTPPPPTIPPPSQIPVKDETQSPSAKSKAKKNAVSKSDAEAMEAARLKAEKAAEQRDLITGDFADIPTAAIRNLTIIETMPVGRTQPGPERSTRADESTRWDDKWNGRKNFKRFKRRGGDEGGARVRKVIVRLEEAKKRDYGIGEDYWLEERDESQKRRRKKGRGTQEQDVDGEAPSQARSTGSTGGNNVSSIPQDGSVPVDDEDEYEGMNADEELAAATAKFKDRQKASANEITLSPDVEIASSRASQRSTHPPASKPTSSSTSTTSAPRGSRSQASSLLSQRTSQTLGDKTSKSQNVPSSSNGTTAGKRSITSSAAGSTKPPPAKRVRGLFARSEDEDSDDDGLAFKFRKRK